RLVGFSAGLVLEAPSRRIKTQDIALLRILRGGPALDDVQAEVERIAPEDVAQAVTADDHELEPSLLGDGLQPGRAHLARGADTEALARNHERLPPMHTLTEIGHQVAEGAELPSLVQPVEALRNAVVGWRDLVCIDRVELLPRNLRIPEDQRPASDQMVANPRPVDRLRRRHHRRGWPRTGSRCLYRHAWGPSHAPVRTALAGCRD